MAKLCNQSELNANLMPQWNKLMLAQAAYAFEVAPSQSSALTWCRYPHSRLWRAAR
jgi:hypothetical protein